MGQCSGNSDRCICSTNNGKDQEVRWQDVAASSCTEAGPEPALTPQASRASGSCASLHGCGVPQVFTVPPGVNVEEHDEEQTRLAVRNFADMMIFGVNLRLAVEGVGVLLVTAALDRRLSTLTFSSNGIRKKLPLRLVRGVVVERQEFCPGEDDHLWHVCLELEGDQLCTFVFDGPEASREASYLGGCLHVLLLEAAAPDGCPREEEGYAGKGGNSTDIASLATRTPPEEQDPMNETPNSTRSVASEGVFRLADPATAGGRSCNIEAYLGRRLALNLISGQNSNPLRAAPALRV
mmetsp:Transcript_57206/g.113695  ORF Transcript_57206/g.113695 Transcript_57206/m.113695 type:complete len:294 (+) Transcript_57206:122-1003(+)